MKAIFLGIVLLFCFAPAICQNKISGRIVGKAHKGIANANVVLYTVDSAMYSGTTTDSLGNFEILNVQVKSYYIKVFSLGYKVPSMLVTPSKFELGELELDEALTELNEVVVTDNKLLQHQFDRIVLKASNSVTASAGSLLDLIEKLPGVLINRQNNTILLRGRDDIQILINDKPSNMSMSVVLQMLSGVNASSIDKIELLNSASSKYDASGGAGILNIVFKSKEDLGSKLSYNVNSGYGRAEKVSGDVNFLRRTKQFSTNLLASYSFNRTREFWESHQHSDTTGIDTYVTRDPNVNNYNLKGEFAYVISSKLTLGINASYASRVWKMNSVSSSNRISNTDSIHIKLEDNETDTWNNFIGGFDINYQLSEKKQLTFDYDYLYYKNTDIHGYNQTSNKVTDNTFTQKDFGVQKQTPIGINVFKLDFENSVSRSFSYSAGAKHTLANFKNRLNFDQSDNYFSFLEGQYALTENTVAAYFNFIYKTQRLKVETGMRYENTDFRLHKDTSEINKRLYHAFFPSVNAFYSFDEKRNLQFVYNYRINRPAYTSLAPFVVFLDPYTFFTGNENLQPSFVHNLELKHGVNNFLFSVVYSAEQFPMIGFQPSINPSEGYQTISPKNLSRRRTATISLYAPVTLTDFWQVSTDMSYSFTSIDDFPSNFQSRLGSFRLSGNSTFKLSSNLTLEISGFCQSTSLSGVTEQRSFGALNTGMKKKFKSIELSMTLSDVFKTNNWYIAGNNSNLNLNVSRFYNFETRIFRIGLSHNIGNQKLEKRRKKPPASTEERNRI